MSREAGGYLCHYGDDWLVGVVANLGSPSLSQYFIQQ